MNVAPKPLLLTKYATVWIMRRMQIECQLLLLHMIDYKSTFLFTHRKVAYWKFSADTEYWTLIAMESKKAHKTPCSWESESKSSALVFCHIDRPIIVLSVFIMKPLWSADTQQCSVSWKCSDILPKMLCYAQGNASKLTTNLNRD